MKEFIQSKFEEARIVLTDFLNDKTGMASVGRLATMIVEAIRNGNKIIAIGNGGSMCDAMHFAEELTGRFRSNRNALPAIAVSDPAHLTCVSNDFGFDFVFSRFVEAMGKKGDVLLAMSTSGNSPNVLNALKAAQECDMQTFCLLGKGGGQCKDVCPDHIIVPSDASERIQEVHIKILHIVIDCLEKEHAN